VNLSPTPQDLEVRLTSEEVRKEINKTFEGMCETSAKEAV